MTADFEEPGGLEDQPPSVDWVAPVSPGAAIHEAVAQYTDVATSPIAPRPDYQAALGWLPSRRVPQAGKSTKKVRVSLPNGVRTTMANTFAGTYADAHAYMTETEATGLGVIMGTPLLDSRVIIGLDLDSCRNVQTRVTDPWARQIIALFNSYTEVSQSGTGVKIYATVAAADVPAIEAAIVKSKGGHSSRRARIWAWETEQGSGHGPKIEFYISAHFFDYTGLQLSETPTEFRRIDLPTILTLIEEYGPAFARADPALRSAKAYPLPSPAVNGHSINGHAGNAHAATPPMAPTWPDNDLWDCIIAAARGSLELASLLRCDFAHLSDRSRSGIAMAIGGALKAAGFEKDEIAEATRSFAPTAEWTLEMDAEQGDRWIERIWDRAYERKTVDRLTDFAHVKPIEGEVICTPASVPPEDAVTAPAAKPATRCQFSLYSIDELMQRLQQPHLIADLIPAGSVVVFGGVPKGGKTHMAVHATYCVASGSPFAGHAVDPAGVRVLYWAGEGIGGIGRRFAANREHVGVSDKGNIRVITGSLCLAVSASVREFITTVQAQGFHPKMIVIDTLARALPGMDENAAKDMGAAIAGADCIKDTFGCTVLLIAHTGKDATRGLRGSSALHGALDVAFRIESAGEGGFIKLTMTDSKESELVDPFVFELRKMGASVVPVVSSHAASIGSGLAGPVGHAEITALDTLRSAAIARQRLQQGPEAGAQQEASNRLQDIPANAFFAGLAGVAVSVDEWRELFLAKQATIPRKTAVQGFRRAKKALQDKRLVIITGNFAQLSPAASMNAQGVYSGSASPNEGVNQ